MNVVREDKRNEAIKRMKEIGISEDVIKGFEEHEIVKMSLPPFGTVADIDDDDVLEALRSFEKDYESMVYFVIKTEAGEIGTLYTMCYVSDHPEEWEMDHNDIKEGYICAYVYNKTIPAFSEIGSIGFEVEDGKVTRTE